MNLDGKVVNRAQESIQWSDKEVTLGLTSTGKSANSKAHEL